jgi:antitoxin YefM
MSMETIAATRARSELYGLIDRAGDEPVRIAGKRGNAVLVSEADWEAIQETLYLLSMPGMRESIRKGLKTPVAKCKRELDW